MLKVTVWMFDNGMINEYEPMIYTGIRSITTDENGNTLLIHDDCHTSYLQFPHHQICEVIHEDYKNIIR